MSGRHDPFPTNLMRHCMSNSGFTDPRAWLLALHKEHRSGKGIAQHLGVSYPTIELWCRWCLVKLERHQNRPRHNYDPRLTPKEIMKKYHVCYDTAIRHSKSKKLYNLKKKGVVNGAQRKTAQAPRIEGRSPNKVSSNEILC